MNWTKRLQRLVIELDSIAVAADEVSSEAREYLRVRGHEVQEVNVTSMRMRRDTALARVRP